jgi:hypothetical protein
MTGTLTLCRCRDGDPAQAGRRSIVRRLSPPDTGLESLQDWRTGPISFIVIDNIVVGALTALVRPRTWTSTWSTLSCSLSLIEGARPPSSTAADLVFPIAWGKQDNPISAALRRAGISWKIVNSAHNAIRITQPPLLPRHGLGHGDVDLPSPSSAAILRVSTHF